jgi:SAM-dependent methyltransferase
VDLESFVLAHLPPRQARILEVGCGAGGLARALARAGHDVTAIDPEAPEGPIFRRVTLEAFVEPGPFDAVVASVSLHHVDDLADALDKIAGLLRPEGVLVLSEYAKERFDRATAEWYYEQRRALAASGGKAAPGSLDECIRGSEEDDAEIHGYAAMRAELDRRFRERFFSWVPYLYRDLEGICSEALEQALIDAGTIRATGFRYVGETAAR